MQAPSAALVAGELEKFIGDDQLLRFLDKRKVREGGVCIRFAAVR